jgi:flavorubredoxin
MSEIKPGIFSVGAQDKDRKTFDELIPLPDGTTYNSYLIIGKDKTALIDTVDPTKTSILLDNLKKLTKKIDYIICNHAEQDHSGSIPNILENYPESKVICSEKCKQMLIDLMSISIDKIITVKDQEEISLGDKTLKFIYTPWVHWPETMSTLLKEDSILFSCDFFGSHFSNELFSKDSDINYGAAKRYYAEIMMPFRIIVKKNIELIKNIKIEIIAPSHGPIYKNPRFIIDAYLDWTSDNVKNQVVIAYVSMHNSTKSIVDRLEESLIKKNIIVKKFNLRDMDLGELAIELVDSATIILASPTFLTGMHPLAQNACYIVSSLKPKAKFLTLVSSYGWGTQIVEQGSLMLKNLNVKILPPVTIKGFPKKEDLVLIDNLADQIKTSHKEIGI